MARRRPRTRRSPREWGLRAALAVVIAIVGWIGLADTLGYVLKGSPARAHAIAPGDGRITALLAQQQLRADGNKRALAEATRLGRLALRQDPTTVQAVSTLGLAAQMRGDTGRARRLFAYSQALSRREFATQLWAIEDAVARGDIRDALRHYDVALRTTRNAPDVLFPILALANADLAIRVPLAETLARRPAWEEAFVGHLIGSGTDWRSVADLFLRVRRLGTPIPEEAEATAVSGLISGGYPADAWRYYAAIRPGVDRRASRDPGFAAVLAAPAPFDWRPVDDGVVTASVQRGGADFAAPSGVGGPVLRQLQLLPPGDYLFDGHGSGIDQPATTRPYWQLSCTDGRELGRVEMPDKGDGHSDFAGRFSVPVGCAAQALTLFVRASDAVGGTTGRIERARLRPAR